ncbi:MAG: hypothetical protein BWX80_03667 [Candidatus Hydrogenedentes bacterium ADurb.Bin101]|nr:MAG: hypothetical protein BWX80_03667 [Candidatus Hydrogenedentes bacterium ADurb.Bin101]
MPVQPPHKYAGVCLIDIDILERAHRNQFPIGRQGKRTRTTTGCLEPDPLRACFQAARPHRAR